MSTNNVLIKYSDSIGGEKHIFTDAIEVEIGGGSFAEADLPASKNVLFAGTPIKTDEIARTAEIHYAFEASDVASTIVQVKKYSGSVIVKAGMFLMKAPASASTSGTAATVNSVDSSNEDYDIVTLSAAISGLVDGDTLVEADQTGAGAVIKVIPNALQAVDLYVDPNGYDYGYTAGYFSKGKVYSRRISPICSAIKDELRKVCFFRFTNSK